MLNLNVVHNSRNQCHIATKFGKCTVNFMPICICTALGNYFCFILFYFILLILPGNNWRTNETSKTLSRVHKFKVALQPEKWVL